MDALAEGGVSVVIVWAGCKAAVVEEQEVDRTVQIGAVLSDVGAGDAVGGTRLA